ncbi:MAG: hypothetical protein DI555_06860 [Novosphingobium pentaromativorans]|uniref:Uncharacterized protein n=1 Tax=Novosphingobium pentaromativorans TaxID=205844 RepID=A0A2W5QWD6_9SPHN|nr:MAG: hypothetical protein DI555_06860 [Novosphingobium pentaromativorans]
MEVYVSTTTKFSGPWHVVNDSQGYDNIHHAPADDGDTGDIVATCYQDGDHARLIAAAPELYDVTMSVEQLFRDLTGKVNEAFLDRFAQVHFNARSALTKARGEVVS